MNITNTHTQQTAITAIQQIVATGMGITVREMCAPCRERRVQVPRAIAMYCLTKLTPLGVGEIARAFRPDMDHSTATQAVKTITARIDTEPEFARTVQQLLASCKKAVLDGEKGSNHALATDAQKARVIELRKQGLSYLEITEQTGLSTHAAERIWGQFVKLHPEFKACGRSRNVINAIARARAAA